MGGKRTKKKQLQVRTIATRSSPLPAPSSQSPTRAKDSHANGVSIRRDLSDESVGDDVGSRASMKGGCGNICRHLERGVNVDKLSCHFAKSKTLLTQCQDCAKDGKTGTNKKAKGRSIRKKLVQTSSFQNGSQQAKKWVCLACGYVGCGAISATRPPHPSEESVERDENGAENANEEGVPTGHAWKHSLLAKHPLALQCGDKLVCWCFFCNMAVEYCFPPAASPDLDNVVEDGRQSVALAPRGTGLLQQAVTLVRDKLLKESVFFEDPGILDQIDMPVKAGFDAMIRNPNSASSSRLIPNGHCSGSQRKRVVKGLMNLGNTCFFNSVMQNLLALDLLRDYFSQDSEVPEGPLTSALRRLYLETNSDGPSSSKAFGHVDMLGLESGMKRGGKGRMAWENTGGAYNPRSLFGAICAKAPRFRGFQQQDSHELLRCLLEGLHSEEQSANGTEGESKKVAGLAKSSALMEGVGGGELESCEEALQHGDAERPSVAQISTLVDNFFGGQLSSTVRCCECGHASVVYERFLDLSLQIPARQVVKKGQARAGEGPLSFLAERSEKDPSHRDVRSTREVQKIDLSETSNTPGHVGAESPKFSLEIFSSASAENKICSSEISSSVPAVQNGSFGEERGDISKANPVDDDSLHDFGWLDFVGGGIQSAEGSLQGSHDVVGQHSENSLIAYAEDSIRDTALMNVSQPLSFAESGNVQSLNDLKPFENEGIGESPVNNHSESAPVSQKDELPSSKCVLDSSGVDAHQDVLVDIPIFGQDAEPEKSMAELNDEDGPLPLASGVLLLPYEHLQVPNELTTESRLDSTEVPNRNLDESSCSLQGEDKGTTSSLLLEQDGGDFDGFSQLFEEDESLPVKDLAGEVRGSLDGSLDASWDVDTGTFVEGESDPKTVGLQKLIEHKDAILPMSLEGCLADFTKSELLSGENAWACERCAQHLKENASPLASDNEGNKSVPYSCKKGVASKRSGGKLGKGRPQIHRKDVPNPIGKEVPSSSKYSNGVVSHADYTRGSVLSCVPNGRVCSASPIEDGSFSESLSGSHASCNGNIEHNSPSFIAGDSNTYKVEKNVRIGNGSARLNELDSGQLPGCQSPLYQTDNEEITYFARGDCTKKLGAMAPMEAVCAEQKIETGVGERLLPQNICKEDDYVDGSQSDQTGELFSAESSGKRNVQKDCTGVGQMNTGTSFSANKEKLPGPFRMSGKALKLQKIKNRKSQLENERVVKRDATKRLLISKAPPILTIHLKRFAQDMRGRLNKLSGHVAFPEVLDLQPFLDSKCLDLENCVYRLIGIVEHGGTMRGGHYIAYVRGPLDETNQETDSMDNGNKSSWHFISDSSVRKSTLPAVLNSDAYLLFYQKCMS